MSSILVSQAAGVLTITLNRPEKLNAFNPEMHSLLRQAIERAADDAGVRVVLLTGSGRGFCAGQDLAERNLSPGAAPIDLSVSIGSYYNPPLRRPRGLPKPIGPVPHSGGTYFLPRLGGTPRALGLALLGEKLS